MNIRKLYIFYYYLILIGCSSHPEFSAIKIGSKLPISFVTLPYTEITTGLNTSNSEPSTYFDVCAATGIAAPFCVGLLAAPIIAINMISGNKRDDEIKVDNLTYNIIHSDLLMDNTSRAFREMEFNQHLTEQFTQKASQHWLVRLSSTGPRQVILVNHVQWIKKNEPITPDNMVFIHVESFLYSTNNKFKRSRLINISHVGKSIELNRLLSPEGTELAELELRLAVDAIVNTGISHLLNEKISKKDT